MVHGVSWPYGVDMARGKRDIPAVRLREAQERFIESWGQMGPSWGISRTMAEAHALLYITGSPLNTDDVMERLRISRGNASMSLRALQEWGLISRVHKRGDRKEYFQAEQDAWAIARTIMRERLRREVLPLLQSLYEIRDQTGEQGTSAASSTKGGADEMAQGAGGEGVAAPEAVTDHNRRLDALVELVQTIDRLGERFIGSEGKGLKLAATMLSRVI